MSCGRDIWQLCGYFRNEHEESDDSGDEDASQSKNATPIANPSKKKRAKVKNKKEEQQSSWGGGTIVWGPFLTQIMRNVKSRRGKGEDREEQFWLLRIVDQKLTVSMLNCINLLPKLHTIEIIRCRQDDVPPGLQMLEDLRVLRMSNNHIGTFSEDLCKLPAIEQIRLDNNKIEFIAAGIFKDDSFPNLEVLNLAHNNIGSLPNDFGKTSITSGNQLKYIDLSYNNIRSLPSSVLECKILEVFNVSNNKIEQLPSSIYRWKNLQRLFVSFNQLTRLPEDIGLCKELMKIRMVENQVKELPPTILNCWVKRGGKLDEFLVARNPLTKPSITAFEMGGPGQAFQLFEEFISTLPLPLMSDIKNGDFVTCKVPLRQRMPADPLNPMLVSHFEKEDACACCSAYKKAWDPRFGEFRNLDLEKSTELLATSHRCRSCQDIKFHIGFMFIATGPVQEKEDPLDADERVLPVRSPDKELLIDVKFLILGQEKPKKAALIDPVALEDAGTKAHVEELADDPMAEQGGDPKVKDNGHELYYFSSYKGDREKVAEVRNAESTLLLLKRQMYFDMQMTIAEESRGKSSKDIPKSLEEFQKGLVVSDWHGKAHVTDVDLYFNLLVFSTKPQFSTCQVLWDKWVDLNANKNHMSKDEWNDLCEGVEVSLPDDVREKMWHLMSWRKQGDKILEVDFVASWHIHDVEFVDAWIGRLATVLQLEYYDMEIEELQDRLKAKSAQEATPQIDFDEGPDDSSEEEGVDPGAEQPLTRIEIEKVEGERRIRYSPLEIDKNGPSDGKGIDPAIVDGKVADLINKVSLTNGQYKDLDSELQGDAGSDADLSDAELSSNALSEESDTASSEFDAQAFCLADENDGMSETEGPADATHFQVNSDERMKQLMDLPFDDFFSSKELNIARGKAKAEPFVRMKARKDAEPRKQIRDKKYKTDVYSVRQAIRRAYRNLPHNDFVKLVNFLLRGMQLMKHGGKDNLGYWHGDDPTFRHTMGIRGSNVYPRDLLRKMGFVTLSPARGGTVWAWPSKLLEAARAGRTAWGEKEVPATCPGKDRHRLDDMIYLLKSCQRNLHKEGRRFTGHFKEQITS